MCDAIPPPVHPTQDELEGFMFLSALPSVVYAGYALAKSRIKSFDDDVMLSSVFMVCG